MKRGLRFLYGILATVVVAFLILNVRVLKYMKDPETSPLGGQGSLTGPPAPARYKGLHSPHAVLVLDISGSMQSSDPGRLQAEAVTQFFRVYRDLSREVLRSGDQAKLAVVLFSTLAQIVDWRGDGDPWLDVSGDADSLMESVARRFLGSEGPDPRTGKDTDYLAAIDAVSELVSGLESPPAVVFMTDGLFDLHPLFSPLVDLRERMRLAESLPPELRTVVADAAAGKLRRIRLQGQDRPFDTRPLGVERLELAPSLRAEAARAISRAREAILSNRYPWEGEGPGVCPLWAPVFLASSATGLDNDVGDVLAGQEPCGPWASHVAVCQDARDLAGEFIGALADWFQLDEHPVAPGALGLALPTESRAFALVVRTEGEGTSFELSKGGRQHRLEGRRGLWAGVVNGGGEWTYRTDAGAVVSGRLLVRPRYQWSLRSPQWVRTTGRGDAVELELLLVSTDTGQAVPGGGVFASLPEVLTLTLTPASSRTPLRAEMRLLPPGPGEATYRGSIPLGSDTPFGTALAAVDLTPMARSSVSARSGVLTRTVDLRPSFRLVLRDPSGTATRVNLGGVPREGAALRSLRGARVEH